MVNFRQLKLSDSLKIREYRGRFFIVKHIQLLFLSIYIRVKEGKSYIIFDNKENAAGFIKDFELQSKLSRLSVAQFSVFKHKINKVNRAAFASCVLLYHSYPQSAGDLLSTSDISFCIQHMKQTGDELADASSESLSSAIFLNEFLDLA